MTVSKTTTTKYFEQEVAKQNAAYEIAARMLSTFPEAGNIFTETGLAEVMRKILDKHLPGTAELQKENARLTEVIAIDQGDCQFYEKEIARLREALEKLVKSLNNYEGHDATIEMADALENAESALNPPKSGAVPKGLSKEKAK